MKNLVPYYFHYKRNLWMLVLSATIYSEAFILIFQPFQSRSWAVSDLQYLRWVSIVVVVGFCVIGVSRLVMFHFVKRHPLSYLSYGVWITCELLAMASIYSLFPFAMLPDYVAQHQLTFFVLFRQALLDELFILLIPYAMVYMIIELREKNEQLAHVSRVNETGGKTEMLNFYDDKGDLKLSLKAEMVFYIESQDNYVSVHYRIGNKPCALLIRNSLKNMEAPFTDSGLCRCHRSFIVNLQCVQLLRRVDGELRLDFGRDDVPPIPVSKGYAKIITEHFTN